MPKITVEFNENKFEIQVKAGASLRDAVTSVIDAPEIAAILEKEAKDSFFEAYRQDGTDNQDWNERAAKAFIEGGKEGLEEWIVTDNDDRVDAEVYDAVEEIKQKSDIAELVDAIIDGVKDARRNKTSEIRLMVEELLNDTLTDLVHGSDDSKPLDMISPRDKVLLSYVPGISGLTAEDIMTQAIDRVQGPTTVLLNERLIRFFTLINLSKSDFLRYCREEQGVDLTDRIVPNGASEYRVKEDAERAKLWREASWDVVVGQPALVSPADAYEIIENATYGGVASLTVKVPLKWFVERDWTQGMTIEPQAIVDNKKTRMVAGQIGIHDFVWGSGHTITNDKTVVIPPCNRDEFVVTEKHGCGFDPGRFVGWALTAGKFIDTPALAPEQKIEDEAHPGMGL